jgi:murein hydrolase activator
MRRRSATVAARLLGSLVLCAGVVVSSQVDQGETEALAARAGERIRALQREAASLVSRERSLLGDLRQLEIERDLHAERSRQGERELARLDTELETLSAQLTKLEDRSRAQRPDVSNRLADLYKLGRPGYVRLLLDVNDLRELGRAYRFVSALEAIDRRRLREYAATASRLERSRAALAAERARRAAVQQSAAAAREASAHAARAVSAMIDDIDARRDLNARFTGELEQAQQQLRQAIEGLAHGAGTAPTDVALPLGPFKGDLDWPVTGAVIAAFGRQQNPRFRTAVASQGVLLATPAGTPVQAIHDGTVAYAEPFTGFGNLVIVDHGQSGFTMYGHLDSLDVTQGVHVRRGQVVGTTGTTVDGTPALYFELRIDGRPVDPLQWLRKQ